MKYIVNTDDFEPHFKVDSIGVFGIGKSIDYKDEDHSWSRIKSVDEFEQLTADYINEHFGELQDTAYQKGLEDAWEAARKISLMSPDEIEKVFPGAAKYNRYNLGYSGAEAIEKLKAYEENQKADDKIEVGDEVEVLNSGSKYLVAWIAETSLCGFAHDGVTCRLQPSDVRKTGRHFDIASILEDMRND